MTRTHSNTSPISRSKSKTWARVCVPHVSHTPPRPLTLGTDLLGHFSAHGECQLQLQLLLAARLGAGLLQLRGHTRRRGCGKGEVTTCKGQAHPRYLPGQTTPHSRFIPTRPHSSPTMGTEKSASISSFKLTNVKHGFTTVMWH